MLASSNLPIIDGFEVNNEIEACLYCRNVYVVIWIIESDDRNVSNIRHCPFCGSQTNQENKDSP